MNSIKTPKGTTLPLITLKGNPYLKVAERMVWFNEEAEKFTISTEFLLLNDEQTVAKAIVVVCDKEGNVIKSATATKREDKKSFFDHTEKAETGAIGRALAYLGYGTQFAVADLDEGARIVDAPALVAAKSVVAVNSGPALPTANVTPITTPVAPKAKGFRKVASASAVASVVGESPASAARVSEAAASVAANLSDDLGL